MVDTHSYKLSPLGPAEQLGGGSRVISASSFWILKNKEKRKSNYFLLYDFLKFVIDKMYLFAEVLSALDILGLQRGVVAGDEAVWLGAELSSTGLLFEVPASVDILKSNK